MDKNVIVIIITNVCSLATLFLIRKNTEDTILSTLYIALKNKILLKVSLSVGEKLMAICQTMSYNKLKTNPNLPFLIKDKVEEVMASDPSIISELYSNERLYNRLVKILDVYIFSLIAFVVLSIMYIYKYYGHSIWILNNCIFIVLVSVFTLLLLSIVFFYFFKSQFRILCSKYGVNENYAPKDSAKK